MNLSLIRPCLMLVLSMGLFFNLACQKKIEASSEIAGLSPEQALLYNQGKKSYNTNCTACHSSNPSKDGSLGPAVSGASYSLLETRILHASYPSDYQPKRKTNIMQALPYLKNDLKALEFYLNHVK